MPSIYRPARYFISISSWLQQTENRNSRENELLPQLFPCVGKNNLDLVLNDVGLTRLNHHFKTKLKLYS